MKSQTDSKDDKSNRLQIKFQQISQIHYHVGSNWGPIMRRILQKCFPDYLKGGKSGLSCNKTN